MGRPQPKKQPGGRGGLVPYERWLDDYALASKWMSRYDIVKLVDDAGGLTRIENFLPLHIAEGIERVLQSITDKEWKDTSAKEDYTHNNIDHSFASVKHAKGLEPITRLFSLLLPGQFHAFSAAKYVASDHIDPHDDRAYTPVLLDSGKVIQCSRDLACIYYLTRDWKEEYGGLLVDLEDPAHPGGKPYVPLYNSAVLFRVPRYHAVTRMTTSRPRYSIFGWFLQPGKLYDLFQGDGAGQGQGMGQQGVGQGQGAGGKQAAGKKGDRQPGKEAAAGVAAAAAARKLSGRKRKERLSGSEGSQGEAPEQPQERRAKEQEEGAGPSTKRGRQVPPPGGSGSGSDGGGAPAPAEQAPPQRRLGGGTRFGPGPDGGRRGAAEPIGPGAEGGDGGDVTVWAAGGGQRGRGKGAMGRVRLPAPWQGRRKHVCV